MTKSSGVKPSYDYNLHNQLLSNESDTIVQIANRNSKIKMSILTLSLIQFSPSRQQLLAS